MGTIKQCWSCNSLNLKIFKLIYDWHYFCQPGLRNKKNTWNNILPEHKSYIKWFTLAAPSIEFRLTSTSAMVTPNGTAFCFTTPTVTPTYTGPNKLNPTTFANPLGGTHCTHLLDFRVNVSNDHCRGQTFPSEGSLFRLNNGRVAWIEKATVRKLMAFPQNMCQELSTDIYTYNSHIIE